MSYDVNLSNGTLFATIHPLEKNGPDNRSTPRRILEVDSINNTFTLSGDVTDRFVTGFVFDVTKAGLISLGGSPETFVSNNTTYTVASPGATYVGGSPLVDKTIIPVDLSGSPSSFLGSPPSLYSGLPLGQIEYTVPNTPGSPSELNSSITLLGQGSMNWGENIAENTIRMLENFASPVSPDNNTNIGTNPAATPITGQWWYKSDTDEFYYYDGTSWVNNYNIQTIGFTDVEDGNKKLYLSASETNLPAPWPGGGDNQPGLVVWQESDPADNEPVFRVLSSNATELLRIEYSSVGEGWTSTVNNVLIETGSATLTLDSDATETSAVTFETIGTERARLYVDDNEATYPLNIQVGIGSPSGPNVTFYNDGTTLFRNIVSVDPTLNYETIILNDDDLTNKKYVDDNFQPIDDDLTTISLLAPTIGQSIVALGSPPTWTAYKLGLPDLSDVDPSLTPSDKEVLTYSVPTNQWISQPLPDIPADFIMVCSNETDPIPTGTVFTFRMPHEMTVTEIRASVSTAPTGSELLVDVQREGSPASILSKEVTIDAGEKTSTTAGSPSMLTGSPPEVVLLDDEEITIIVNQVGSPASTGVGLKVTFKGTRVYP